MLSPLYGQLSPLRVPTAVAAATDADALAYIAAVEAADGQSLEEGVATAFTDFIVGCKADGIWSAIKAACILAGARTLDGALVPLVGSAPTNNNFVSGDYNRETGLKGNGSTKYLDSNRNINDDPQNDRHISIFANTAQTSGTAAFYVGAGGGFRAYHFGRSGTNPANLFARNVSSSVDLITGEGAATAFIGMTRSSSTGFDFRSSGSTGNYSRTSEVLTAGDILIFNSSGQGAYTDARLSFYSIGESLDLAALNSRVSTLMTDLAAAI